MNDTTYDDIVIGKGLMGTAAARHLSATAQRVALIGPDEPANRSRHAGIFGSHYDEGRITRILDPDRIWALLAQRSLARYRQVEEQSGMAFYSEVGHLMVAPEASHAFDFVSRVQRVAAQLGVAYETYTDAALAERFPYLAFEPGSVGLYQPHTAGYVSPRLQVQAQAAVAQKQGVTLITETVDRLHQTAGHVEVHTDAGQTYQAKQVLLATGGFSNAKGLLPQPLDIAVHARTIILLEIGATDAARLHGMPSLIYKPRDPAGHCYILPPIRYPNGKTYLKIGGHPDDPTLDSLASLQGWFRGSGDPAAAQHLRAKLQGIVRHLQPLSIHSEACVTTHTPGEQIYAARLQGGRLGVLVGGNGSAAKSADEIGRLGALMMAHEEWAYDIEAHHFQVQFAKT